MIRAEGQSLVSTWELLAPFQASPGSSQGLDLVFSLLNRDCAVGPEEVVLI